MEEILKHTPGPWRAGSPATVGEREGIDITRLNGEPVVTAWWVKEGGGPIVMEANANLVATAPEFYEVARKIYSLFKRITDADGNINKAIADLETTKTAIARLRRAVQQSLRKAEGRT